VEKDKKRNVQVVYPQQQEEGEQHVRKIEEAQEEDGHQARVDREHVR